MTLTELGMEYLREEAKLKKRLADIIAQYKECEDKFERKKLAMRIYYLRREIFDCHEWGEYLISYYNQDREEVAI